MKKTILFLFALIMLGSYSCTQENPGIEVPLQFGESAAPWAVINVDKNAYALNETFFPTADMKNVESYSWDFGDLSSPSTLAKPTHRYVNKGTYTIKLTVYSANHAKKYIASTRVIAGTRFFDSAVLVKISASDSNQNPWTNNSQNPRVGFNLKQEGGSPMINFPTRKFFKFDVLSGTPVGYSDNTQGIVLKPVAWNFYLDCASIDNPAPADLKPMHSWIRDMGRETSNPILLKGSRQQPEFLVKVYWSLGN